MNVPAQGFAEGIESQMLNLTNVTECKVYDNKTDSAVDGIPPHGIRVIVRGGNSQEVATVIYNNLPPGIRMTGNIGVEISRVASGQTETIYYDIAQASPLGISATVKEFTAGTLDQDFVKKQLEQMNFTIKEMVTAADIITVMSNAIGDIGTPYDIVLSAISTSFSYTQGNLYRANVNKAAFETAMGITTPAAQTYTFSYLVDTWTYNSNPVDLADYGITVTGEPVNHLGLDVIYNYTGGEYLTPQGLNEFFTISANDVKITVV